MKGLIKYLSGNNKPIEKTEIALEKSNDAEWAVVVEGEKHFDIFIDGNGYYKAQHKSGDWLFTKESLISFEYAYKTKEFKDLHELAMFYINANIIHKVGTIEFIPSK